MLRLIERGLKKISGKENKTSKIIADIFLFLYVAASHGTTTLMLYSISTLWFAESVCSHMGLIRRKKRESHC